MSYDTPDFRSDDYAKRSADGADYLDVSLADVLAELESINIQTANIQNATLSVDRPARYSSGVPIFTEQWEHGNGFWISSSSGTGGSSSRSNTHFYSKGYGWELIAGSSLLVQAVIECYLGRYPQAQLGFQFCFTLHADLRRLEFYTIFPYNDNAYCAYLIFDLAGTRVYIYDENFDTQEVIPVWSFTTDEVAFHFVKLTVDLETGKYDTLYFDDQELDLSAYGLYPDTGYTGEDWQLYFKAKGSLGKNPTVYLDDICITEEG